MSTLDTSESCLPGSDGGAASASGERPVRRRARIRRIPARLWRDIRLIGILRNWPDALRAEITGRPPAQLRLRSGVVLHGLPTLNLAFLFHEIYLRRAYSPPGYEIRRGDVVVDVGANIG